MVELVSKPEGLAGLRTAVDLFSDTLLSHLAQEEGELVAITPGSARTVDGTYESRSVNGRVVRHRRDRLTASGQDGKYAVQA